MYYTPKKKETPVWEKKALSLDEAAAYFGISPAKISKLCRVKGQNFAVSVEGKIFIKREKLEAYLDGMYSI